MFAPILFAVETGRRWTKYVGGDNQNTYFKMIPVKLKVIINADAPVQHIVWYFDTMKESGEQPNSAFKIPIWNSPNLTADSSEPAGLPAHVVHSSRWYVSHHTLQYGVDNQGEVRFKSRQHHTLMQPYNVK